MKLLFSLLVILASFCSLKAQPTSYDVTPTSEMSIKDIIHQQFGRDSTVFTVEVSTVSPHNEYSSCWSQGLQEKYKMFLEDVQLPSNHRLRTITPTDSGLHIWYKLRDGSQYYIFVRRMYFNLEPMLNEVRF